MGGQRSIIVVVAGKVFVVGAGMIVSGARGAMAGGFDMQKTYGYFMGKGEAGRFDLMADWKCSTDGKAGQHRYQSQCNYFSEYPIQVLYDPRLVIT